MLTPRPLDEEFDRFGQAVNPYGLITGKAMPTLGDKDSPVQFFADLAIQNLGPNASNQMSWSVCYVEPREAVETTTEYHLLPAEAVLPMDDDVVLVLGLPNTDNASPREEDLVAYIVPSGTLVVLKPGVRHYAPFAAGKSPVVTWIGLPYRTYAVDCHERPLSGDGVLIKLPYA